MLGITGRCHCLMLICEVQVESAQQHCTNFMMCRSDHEKMFGASATYFCRPILGWLHVDAPAPDISSCKMEFCIYRIIIDVVAISCVSCCCCCRRRRTGNHTSVCPVTEGTKFTGWRDLIVCCSPPFSFHP